MRLVVGELNRYSLGFHQRAGTDDCAHAVHETHNTLAWKISKIVRLRNRQRQFPALFERSPAQRMLRESFGRRGELYDIQRGHTFSRLHVDDLRSAKSEGAGFVEHYYIGVTEALEITSTLDDHAFLRRAADGAQNGQGSAGGDAAGARNDDHGDCRTRVARDPERECRAGQRKIYQVAREPVGDFLDRSARMLRPLNQFDDPSECRVGSNLVRLNFQHAGLIERPGEHAGAGNLFRRHRFSGDIGLIHKGMAAHHYAIHRECAHRAAQ